MDYRVLLFAFKASAQWIASCSHQSSKCHHFLNRYLLIPYCVLICLLLPALPVFVFLSVGCCLHFCCFSSFLHFSYLPFLLLFPSLLCLLKSQSIEEHSYLKFWLIEDTFTFTYFICPLLVCLPLSSYLADLSKTLFQNNIREEKLVLWKIYPYLKSWKKEPMSYLTYDFLFLK